MRTASICPTCATYENSLCVIYDGIALDGIGVEPLDSLDVILAKINAAIVALQPTTTTTTTTLP